MGQDEVFGRHRCVQRHRHRKCLRNAVTAEVDLGAGNSTGFATYRELALE